MGPLRLTDGTLCDDPGTMANIFVESFASVFTNGLTCIPRPHQACSSSIDDLIITPNDVYEVLMSLDSNSSMGEDGIHPRFLKQLAEQLSVPLCILFNSSLQTGILPDLWLSSLVVPIFKKNSRYDPLNYRPVSLTSAVCKVFERILVKHLSNYLEENSIISELQFGFRAAHSTVDQLIVTYNDITSMIDQGNTVDLVFFDFSKAFDLVDHALLITKLQELGIVGNVLD